MRTTQRKLARGKPQHKILHRTNWYDRETSLVEVLAYMGIGKMKNLRTMVYVDGFNLYFGALKDKQNRRWLDIEKMVKAILPNSTDPMTHSNDIVGIKYFTAEISVRANHPNQKANQTTYLKAIQANPKVEVILGRYDTHVVSSKLETPIAGIGSFVRVHKTEEKGSDVNLATHLLHDAHTSAFDVAIVISNDSDLVLPIDFVVSKLQKKVGVICPYSKVSMHLKQVSTFIRNVRPSNVTNSQMNDPVICPDGDSLNKPFGW